jgi:hypothetical protein
LAAIVGLFVALGFSGGVLVGLKSAPAAVAVPVLPNVCNYIPTSLVAAAVGVLRRELLPPDANVGNGSSVERVQSCIFNGSRTIANDPGPELFTADNVYVGSLNLLPPFRAAFRKDHASSGSWVSDLKACWADMAKSTGPFSRRDL